MRRALVDALVSCAERPLQPAASDFAMGLSCDELQFIAEFLGSDILEADEKCRCSRAQLAQRIAAFQRARVESPAETSPDQDHKMILLLEFLCRSGLQKMPAGVRVRQA